MECGTWRSGRRGGAAGSVSLGKGRRLDQPGGCGSRGGKSGPLGHEKAIGGNAQRGMVMKAGPAAALVMAEAQFLLELQVVALDQPTLLGLVH